MNCLEALEKPRAETPPGLPLLLVAAAALIDKDGRVLVAQRPEGKPMAGLWEFPGGKVKDGETPEYALCREIAEELGIEVRECCFTPIAFASHSYKDFHLVMPLYVCRMWKGIVTPRENQAVKWMKLNELYSLDMPEADVPLISQLMERL
jgi:8-oxo-dGTP diphosphatase